MSQTVSMQEIDDIVAIIRQRTSLQPKVAIILGSGLSGLAAAIAEPTIIPYGELPGWPRSTVEGHVGQLVLGNLEGQPVFVMQGRIHFYEGYSMQQVTLPVRVMQRIGVEILIVTNAAGAVNQSFAPGDVMLIADQINLPGMTGFHPLIGPNLAELGPRFPDMSQAYDRDLQRLAREVAAAAGIALHEGVYIGLSGPSFETPAELRFLQAIGVDAVGMSTVWEVAVARHGNMRVLGFSGISNKANLDGSTLTTHEEVLEAGRSIVPKLETLIRGVLRKL